MKPMAVTLNTDVPFLFESNKGFNFMTLTTGTVVLNVVFLS